MPKIFDCTFWHFKNHLTKLKLSHTLSISGQQSTSTDKTRWKKWMKWVMKLPPRIVRDMLCLGLLQRYFQVSYIATYIFWYIEWYPNNIYHIMNDCRWKAVAADVNYEKWRMEQNNSCQPINFSNAKTNTWNWGSSKESIYLRSCEMNNFKTIFKWTRWFTIRL